MEKMNDGNENTPALPSEPFSPDEFKQKVADSSFVVADVPRLVATVLEVSGQGKFFKDVLRCICIASGKEIVCGKGAIKALTSDNRILVKDAGSMYLIRCSNAKPKILEPGKDF